MDEKHVLKGEKCNSQMQFFLIVKITFYDEN